MANIVFYIVGHNHLKFNGDIIQDDFREKTEKTLELVASDEEMIFRRKELEFPHMEVLTKYFRQEHIKIHRVILFATDQTPYHSLDTIYSAQLLSRYCEKKIKNNPKIEIQVVESNPTEYDQMLKYFQSYVQQLEIKKTDNPYVVITSDTPAMTTALLFAISPYAMQSELLNIHRGAKNVQRVKLAYTMHQTQWKEILKKLVKDYQYASAAELIANGPFSSHVLISLLRSLNNLVNFCPIAAEEHMNKYIGLYSLGAHDLPKKLRILRNFIDSANDGDIETLMELLLAVLKLKFRTEHINESVVFAYRFQEAFLIRWTERLLGISIISDKKIGFEPFFDYLKTDEELAGYLDKRLEDWRKKTSPTRILYLEITGFFQKNPERLQHLGLDWNALKRMRTFALRLENDGPRGFSLMDLRNHGPYGHGLKGTTKEIALEAYGADFNVEIEQFLEDLLGEPPYNPFESISSYLLKEIEQLS